MALIAKVKLAAPLFTPRLPFSGSALRSPVGYAPEADRVAIAWFTTASERFAATLVANAAMTKAMEADPIEADPRA